MKMLHAGAKMRETRCLVIKGKSRADAEMPHLGIKLRTIPAAHVPRGVREDARRRARSEPWPPS